MDGIRRDSTASRCTMKTDTLPGSSLRNEGVGCHVPALFVFFQSDRPLAESTAHSLGDVEHVLVGRGDARRQTRSVEAGTRTLALQLADRHVSLPHASL